VLDDVGGVLARVKCELHEYIYCSGINLKIKPLPWTQYAPRLHGSRSGIGAMFPTLPAFAARNRVRHSLSLEHLSRHG
jgi:hypothetical protein